MPPNKTLYVREDDLGIWERAEGYAKATGQSVSMLVTAALGRYLPPEGAKADICVEVGKPAVRTVFTGRWLVAPEPGLTGTTDARFSPGAYFGIAITARGHSPFTWPMLAANGRAASSATTASTKPSPLISPQWLSPN